MTGKRSKKLRLRRLVRHRGYLRAVYGWGGVVRGYRYRDEVWD